MDILAFIEDPGAANFVAPVLPELASAGCQTGMFATAAGAEQLAKLSVVAERIEIGVDAEKLLDHWNPRLVLVGTSENPDTLGLKLVAAARCRGIVSVGVVDGPANPAWRFRGLSESPLACAPDWILVANEATRANFVSLGHPPEKILAVGHPHYDRVWERRDQLESTVRQAIRNRIFPAAGARRIVTFIAEISDGLNQSQYSRSPNYTLRGRGTSSRRTDIVLEEVLDALALVSPRPYFGLRLHPKNAPDEFAAYRSEMDFISRTEDAQELVYASDLVAGMTSHLMIEAAILGCPTLAVLPRLQEREWLATIAAGLTACAVTRTEVRALLPRFLAGESGGQGARPCGEAFSRGAAKRAAGVLAGLVAKMPKALPDNNMGEA